MAHKQDEKFPGLQEALKYAGLGVQVAGALLVYIVIGFFLDRWLGTTPWLTIVGAAVGFAAMIGMLYRIGVQANRESQERRRKKGNAP
jgi:F0F1-type ATP synthase assembly protein I